MKHDYNPTETCHCAACGQLGHIGGMLLQPGRVWVHVVCARNPASRFAVEQRRIQAAARYWRKRLKHARHEPWAEKRYRRKVA